MSVFKMPSLGADMEAGELVEWLVKPGDTVAHGDVIAVVETHKGAIEIEIFEAGVIEQLDVKVGESVPVGTPMALIRTAGKDSDDKVTTPDSGQIPPQDVNEDELCESGIDEQDVDKEKVKALKIEGQDIEKGINLPAPELVPVAGADVKPKAKRPDFKPASAPGATTSGQRLASPAARRRAAETDADLAQITGTGPDGAVLLSDVEHWLTEAETPAADAKKADREPAATTPTTQEAISPRKHQPVKQGLDMVMMRQAIAAAMSRSKREIPHYYLTHQIDLQSATDWLAARNAQRDPEERLLMGALFVKATALAAAKVPELNGTLEDGVFNPSDAVNCGLAISMRGGGLIAPALHDAGAKTLDELMKAMRDVVARTRTGRLRNSEITQGTITVSSMGENGTDALLGVIYPPQVALVGFGTPARRPWVVDDKVLVRTIVEVTLAADHRASDGRRGARLLTEIERLLREPDEL